MNRAFLANRLKFAAFRFGCAAVRPLPPRIAYLLATLIAEIVYCLTPSRRRAIEGNIGQVTGSLHSARLRQYARSAFKSVALNYVDLMSAPVLDADQLRKRRVTVHGFEQLAAALAGGHGAILATVHYGCPEIALQAAHAWAIEILVLTEPIQPTELSDLFDRSRASHGHRFMTVGLNAGKEALRTLRRGGAVLIAVDRDIQGHGISVDYFSAPARMPTGAVELARRSGAPIVPALSHRLAGGGAMIELGSSIELVDSGDPRADLATNVRRLLERFEDPIRADPGQWLVLEPLWASYTASATGRGRTR
jgi:KDO2-lipid IV(A) lauroyltransferase